MVNPTRGRPVDPNKDRDILEAGRTLLIDKGPQAVTMEAVARRAGVAKPTLYRRYANRDELLAAVALNESEAMSGRFRATPGSVDDLKRALGEFGLDLKRFMLSDEYMRFVQALGASTGLPQASRVAIFENGPLATRDRLADWLGKAADAGLLRCPRPEHSAEQFIGMLVGLNLVRTLYRVRDRQDAAALEAHVRRVVDDFLALHRGNG